MFGKTMTVNEVLDEVEKDSSFYRSTGGGMSIRGGELMLQPDFSAALLDGAHKRGINTAIETACNVPWANLQKVLPHVDTMLHDHKLTIPERHKKWTGAGNERILAGSEPGPRPESPPSCTTAHRLPGYPAWQMIAR